MTVISVRGTARLLGAPDSAQLSLGCQRGDDNAIAVSKCIESMPCAAGEDAA